MDGVFFDLDYKVLVFIALCVYPFLYIWRWKGQFSPPSIKYSDILAISNGKRASFWDKNSHYLLLLSFFLFLAAFANPRLLIEKGTESEASEAPPPTQGIAIYLVLDQSGSMNEKVFANTPNGMQLISKIDLVKLVTAQFIIGDSALSLPGRPNDLIGLIYFARAARIVAPLTLDKGALLEQLSKFNVINDKDQDGTSIGYAIYKAASLMAATKHYGQELIQKGKPAYTIKSQVMILLTDGLQDPNPLDKGKRLRNMDVPEAALFAKTQGIRLYIVNVEPKLSTEEFTPYRNIMQRAAVSTGGKFYMVDEKGNLDKIYHDIDQLEKGVTNTFGTQDPNLRPDLYNKISFYPFLLSLGLIFLSIFIFFDGTIFRRVP